MVDDEAKHESLMEDIMVITHENIGTTIDYERMKRANPKHKAALTRAKKTGRYSAVLAACTDAVREWDAIGAWPDGWHTWNIALQDAAFAQARTTGEWPAITQLGQI